MSFSLGDRIIFGLGSVLLLGTAVALRAVDLANLPGVNGDEAYYGALIMDLKAGKNPPLVTGSGLILNPFYSGPLFLMHVVWPTPSFTVLRLPALLSGLLALVLAYPLLVRIFDWRIALVTTLLLACLPIAIAYSRFGWDQAQAPAVCLICLYFAYKRQPRAALLSLLMALIVHPANLFLAPIMIGPAVAEWIAAWRKAPPEERAKLRQNLPLGGGVVLLSLGIGLVLLGTAAVLVKAPAMLQGILGRLVNPLRWYDFAVAWGDFLTGATIYRFITGAADGVVLERILFWSLLLVLLVLGLPPLIRRRDLLALGVLGGLFVSLAGFFLAVGIGPIGPGFERYAMYLVTPSCLAVAILICATGEGIWAARGQLVGTFVVGGLLLYGFQQYYLAPLLANGGSAHRTFHTGAVEPKQAALDYIFSVTKPDEPVTILAEDWWLYFPVNYLAKGRPTAQVVSIKDIEKAPPAARHFVVGFVNGPYAEWLAAHAPGVVKREFVDFAGRPVVCVWELPSGEEQLRLAREAKLPLDGAPQ